ncbi:MAG: ribosome maturation factor [Balneolaceae bacterium]
MDPTTLKRIGELATPVIEAEGLFLVDVEEKGGDESILWICVDAEDGGVKVDACSRISRELGLLIDAHEIISHAYRLNVSSPGLSRPLTDPRQFPKNRGRVIRVKYKDSDGEYQKAEGRLEEVTDTELVVCPDEKAGVPIAVMRNQVVEAKIIPSI